MNLEDCDGKRGLELYDEPPCRIFLMAGSQPMVNIILKIFWFFSFSFWFQLIQWIDLKTIIIVFIINLTLSNGKPF